MKNSDWWDSDIGRCLLIDETYWSDFKWTKHDLSPAVFGFNNGDLEANSSVQLCCSLGAAFLLVVIVLIPIKV